MSITLTHSQQEAVDAFHRFLFGSEQVFMLKGAAGTGKTTLLLEFLKILRREERTVSLMAPTGRAAHIISMRTGVPAFTIHKSIYTFSAFMSVANNTDSAKDVGLQATYGLKKNDEPENAVYIVDESSMVSDTFSANEAFSFGSGKLLSDLFNYARGHKIVFVGDYAQLPPVDMDFSPALDEDYIRRKFGCGVVGVTLKEVIRQADGSVMLSNATKLRDSIERKSFNEFRIEVGPDSIAENDNLLKPYFQRYGLAPSVMAAIITFSNRQALQYNRAVRRHYFGADAPRLKGGDLLMIARNNYAHDVELFNGNIVRVESCAPDAEVETRTVTVKAGKGKTASVDLVFRQATIVVDTNEEPVSLNVAILDNFINNPHGSVGGRIVAALIVDFETRLPLHLRDRLPEIKRLLRWEDKMTDDQAELCEEYTQLLKSDPYYNTVICKYGYAMTCHKAQGGEWDDVFVDMSRNRAKTPEVFFRWSYTALTRASKRLWHYRAPAFNHTDVSIAEPDGLGFTDVKAITDLRKLGRLEEALCAAEKSFAVSRDGYSAGALFWCLNELCKSKTADGEIAAIYERMKQLCGYCTENKYMPAALAKIAKRVDRYSAEIKIAIELAKNGNNNADLIDRLRGSFASGELPASLHHDYGWLLYYTLKNTPLSDAAVRKRLLLDYLKLTLPRPGLLHSLILGEAVKVEKSTPLQFRIRDFMKLWGWDNFREDDWAQFTTDNGSVAPSQVERLIGVFAKELVTDNVASPVEFRTLLDEALRRFPDNPYLPICKAAVLKIMDDNVAAEGS